MCKNATSGERDLCLELGVLATRRARNAEQLAPDTSWAGADPGVGVDWDLDVEPEPGLEQGWPSRNWAGGAQHAGGGGGGLDPIRAGLELEKGGAAGQELLVEIWQHDEREVLDNWLGTLKGSPANWVLAT